MNGIIKKCIRITAAVALLTALMSLAACSKDNSKGGLKDLKGNIGEETKENMKGTFTQNDENADIDLDSLNRSVESIRDLQPDTDVSTTGAGDSQSDDAGTSANEPKGDKTVYSYTDVYRDGNDLTVIPNGGLNGSTVLYGGKDLNGFLDYVDSTVLETGRTINRDFFYDILAIMLVDKDLSSDFDTIEKNMLMALAMANDFHNTDVKINDCYLDANNAADYHYHVTAFGKDDTWIVNYGKRTVYMNNGATEYSSDMFKDEYLAVWMVAIEEYYTTD